jgi:uncharacterized protein YegJ (DUF2314 family)
MAEPSSNSPHQEPTIAAPAGDARLERATARARNRLPEFLAKLREQPEGVRFFVKHAFRRSDGKGLKHMWVRVSRIDGDAFVGTLENDPAGKVPETRGQVLRVPLATIEDWAYDRGGQKTVGAFSDPVLAEIERMRPPRA